MIDLHTHSNVSDGTYTPADLVRYARTKGLQAIALTDHDCVDGLTEATSVGRDIGVEVVPGVELSVEHPHGEMHILGLLLDQTDPTLHQGLAILQNARIRRNWKIIERFQNLGVAITLDEVEAVSGRKQIGRPHFARVLMEKGYVRTISEAFEKYLDEGRPAFVEKDRLSPAKAIGLIHGANGLAVLAHPNTLHLSHQELEALVSRLAESGLDGIETYYSTHTADQTAFYEQLASKCHLTRTGGSDFHGRHKPNIDLGTGTGNLRVPDSLLLELRRKRMMRRGTSAQGEGPNGG